MDHFALIYNNSDDPNITFQPSEEEVNKRIINGYDLFENKIIPEGQRIIHYF